MIARSIVPQAISDSLPGSGLGSRISYTPARDKGFQSPLHGSHGQPVLSPDPILNPLDFLRGTEQPGPLISLPRPNVSPVVDSSGNGLVTAFYVFFHPPHPFLVPHFQMLELLQRTRVRHLELALQYIGSFYVPSAPTAQYYESLKEALADESLSQDGTVVQALLLLAVGTHINDQEEESANMLQKAIQVALEIGMHKREYAQQHGNGHMLVEESWRRTWWELFVIDGMMSGVNPMYKMLLADVPLEVALPSEEDDYTMGVSGTSAKKDVRQLTDPAHSRRAQIHQRLRRRPLRRRSFCLFVRHISY